MRFKPTEEGLKGGVGSEFVLEKNLKFFISTYGCQMNVNDSERMATLLEMMNFSPDSVCRFSRFGNY